MKASLRGYVEVVQTLIARKAVLDLKDQVGYIIYFEALVSHYLKLGNFMKIFNNSDAH